MDKDKVLDVVRSVAEKLATNGIRFALVIDVGHHQGSVVTNVGKIQAAQMMIEGTVSLMHEDKCELSKDTIDKIKKDLKLPNMKITTNEC